MNKKLLAKIISLVLNPVIFLLSLPFLVVYRQTANFSSAIKWEAFSCLFILLGLAIIFLGIKGGVFSDQDLSKRKEREGFYYFALILSFFYVFIALFLKGVFFHLSILGMGIFLAIIILTWVNKYIKASIHMATLVAFIIAIGILFGINYFFIGILAMPLVFWARLYLKRHTRKELYIGGILGILITLATFFMAAKILEYGTYV